jgi:hypothetical protein
VAADGAAADAVAAGVAVAAAARGDGAAGANCPAVQKALRMTVKECSRPASAPWASIENHAHAVGPSPTASPLPQ